MKAEKFRNLKTVCVYNSVESNMTSNFTQESTVGDYRLVTLGIIIRSCQQPNTAGLLLSTWNSMVRNNKWSSRATEQNVLPSELPISAAARKMLCNLRGGRISKRIIDEQYNDDVLGWKEIDNYVTALYFEAQVFNNPIAKFKQALGCVIGQNIAGKLIRNEPQWGNFRASATFEVQIHNDNSKIIPIDISNVPVLIKYRDEEDDATRYVTAMACKAADVQKLVTDQGLFNAATKKFCADTSAGCFKHIMKVHNARELCWFE